jgi:hypothetical protein
MKPWRVAEVVKRIAMRDAFSSTWYDGKVQPVRTVYLRRGSLGCGRLLLTRYSVWCVESQGGEWERCVSIEGRHVEGQVLKRCEVRLG